MCTTCGCGSDDIKIENTITAHNHDMKTIDIEQSILAKNQGYADSLRKYFIENNIVCLNIVSSPGSGKTTLLANTIREINSKIPCAVIEGDQQTSNDANRIRAAGAQAIQINTGKGCHLDAHMVQHAVEKLNLDNIKLLFIENVGNLVCPAAFDLGEVHKVVLLSVTEGDDKPLKYPDMFDAADIMIINKIDLLPYVDFNIDNCIQYARRINPNIKVIKLSATSKQGFEQWQEVLSKNIYRMKLQA